VATDQGKKIIASNRRARHDYTIESTVEAGLVLTGTEVKSLRAGRATLTEGYGQIIDNEAWLYGVHIPQYAQGTWTNHEPRRTRKLLMHRKEIDKLASSIKERGLTLIPLSLYFTGGKVKIELGLARGKRAYDKRQDLAKRDAAREVERELRRRR
jgi:SsrA-binding protein